MEPLLEKRILACPTLPTLPAVALDVLALCQRDEVDVREVVECLERDPALAAKVLRLANSVSLSARGTVGTLRHAVMLLGTNAVVALALGFSLVQRRRRDDTNGFDHTAFWRRALVTAVGGRAIARTAAGVDPDVAFVCGLMQELGMLALNEALRREYGRVLAETGGEHERLPEAERRLLGADHAEVAGLLARSWHLPEDLVAALRHHHGAPGTAPSPLARCSQLARLVAGLFVEDATADARGAAVTEACGALGLAPGDLALVLDQVEQELPMLAEALEVEISGRDELRRVLDLARETLVLVSFRSARSAQQAERTIEALASEKRALEQRSRRDALTGVANRGHGDDFLREACAAARRDGRTISLVLCDLDDFKLVNDGYGHATGDALLRAVAAALAESVRTSDLVARWGGDEFVAILPDTDAEGARVVADRIRARVAEVLVRGPAAEPVRAGMSVGVGTAARGSSAEALLEAADVALYDAKRGGRGRVGARDAAPGSAAGCAA